MGDKSNDDKRSELKQATLEEVQRRFEAARKRIREIERKALAKSGSNGPKS